MALMLQELLHRVAPFQGDLKDEVSLQAMRNAARRLARQTLIWQVDAPLVLLETGAGQVYGETDYLRWGVALDTPTTPPTDIDSPYYKPEWFKIIRVQRMVLLNDDLSIRAVLRPQNDREIMDRRKFSSSRIGSPSWFAAFGDQVTLWPLPDQAYSYAGTVALEPMGNAFTAVDFCSTSECEDAIVYGAIAEVLMHPGKHQDKELSMKFDAKCESAILDVRMVAELGGGGHYAIKNFPGWSGYPDRAPLGRIFF